MNIIKKGRYFKPVISFIIVLLLVISTPGIVGSVLNSIDEDLPLKNDFLSNNFENKNVQLDDIEMIDEKIGRDQFENWSYRKRLDIVNPLENYQMLITVYKEDGHDDVGAKIIDCENHCNNNFSDIRFVDSDEITLLSYWVQETGIDIGDNYAVIWVNTSGSDYIYLYYGNPDASPVSNGDTTFGFFDDFNGPSLDTDKWYDYSGGYTISEGEITFDSLNDGIWKYLKSKIDFTNEIIVEYLLAYYGNWGWDGTKYDGLKLSPLGGSIGYCGSSLDPSDHGDFLGLGQGYDCTWNWTIASGNGINSHKEVINLKTQGSVKTYYNITLTWANSYTNIYIDYPLIDVTYNTYMPDDPMPLVFGVRGKSGSALPRRIYIDHVFVHKYADPEPTWIVFGNEEPINRPPNPPSAPSGQTTITAGIYYTYSTSTTDPENNQIYYQWDWGNAISEWLGPYYSGELVTTNYSWIDQGTFPVKVKAKDIHEAESSWSDALIVSVSALSSNWKGNVKITDDTHASQYPSMINDSFDNIHLVWQDDRNGNWEIYYKKLSKDGTELVTDTKLTDDTASSRYPSIAVDSYDNVHIVWQDGRDGNDEIYYTKLDNNGITLIDDLRITDDSASSRYPKAMASDLDNIHITWQDSRDISWEVYYKKLNVTGYSLTDDTRISNLTYDSEHPSLAVYNDNLTHITWHDNRTGYSEIYYDDVYVDLVPISINYTSSFPASQYLAVVGHSMTIEIEVENLGDISVYDVRVDILLDDTVIKSNYTDVHAGSSAIISFDWTPNQQGHHIFHVNVDPEEKLTDYNRANNILSQYLPILDPSSVYETPWIVTSTEEIFDTIIACNQIYIESTGKLHLDNSTLIMFGNNPGFLNDGRSIFNNSVITTDHSSHYTAIFDTSPMGEIEITNSEISQLGGEGLSLHATPPDDVIISRNTIKNSEYNAISCIGGGGIYSIDNNTILNSGLNDFNLWNAYLNVNDSYFDREKVHLEESAEINCSKHIQLIFWNENGTFAENAYVEVKDSFNNTLYSGYTDENGMVPSQCLPVYKQWLSMPTNFTPLQVYAENQITESFTDFNIYPGGLFTTGISSYGGHFAPMSIKNFALLIAGSDKSTAPYDRKVYWDDIEFMYRVLNNWKCYRPKNIQLLFMNGKDGFGKSNSIINYLANRSNLEKAFQYIGDRIGESDTLFIYTTDHGGTGHSVKIGTLCMTDKDNIYDHEFAEMIDTYIGDKAPRIYVVMNQCFGGRFIDNLLGPNRFIQTATKPTEESVYNGWTPNSIPGHQSGHSYFSVEYISAFNNHELGIGNYPKEDDGLSNYPTDRFLQDPDKKWHKNPINKDLDDDSNSDISFHEAFDYALDHDLFGPVDSQAYNAQSTYDMEHPQEIDDDVVVVAGYGGDIKIFRYDGYSELCGSTVNVGGNIKRIFICDMNMDDIDDLVVVDCQASKVKVLLNNGDWTFTTASYNTGSQPNDIYVTDLDHDGDPEVISANLGSNDISVFYNHNGNLIGRSDFDVGTWPTAVVAADLDGQKYKDVAVCNIASVSILLARSGEGYFKRVDYEILRTPTGITAGDIDNDGDNDLVVTVSNGTIEPGRIAILWNMGSGEFEIENITEGVGISPYFPYLVDLDKNGYKDLLFVNYLQDSFKIYNNAEGAGFVYHSTYSVGWSANSNPLQLFSTDLDGDEDFDIIVPTFSDNSVWVFINKDFNSEAGMQFDKGMYTSLPLGFMPLAIHGTNHNRPRGWYP